LTPGSIEGFKFSQVRLARYYIQRNLNFKTNRKELLLLIAKIERKKDGRGLNRGLNDVR